MADDRTEAWRETVEVTATLIADTLGTLTVTELSDLQDEERLFVNPKLMKGVKPGIPKLRPCAVTDTDPLFGASLGLTTEISGRPKVTELDNEPNATERKIDTEAGT